MYFVDTLYCQLRLHSMWNMDKILSCRRLSSPHPGPLAAENKPAFIRSLNQNPKCRWQSTKQRQRLVGHTVKSEWSIYLYVNGFVKLFLLPYKSDIKLQWPSGAQHSQQQTTRGSKVVHQPRKKQTEHAIISHHHLNQLHIKQMKHFVEKNIFQSHNEWMEETERW